MVVARRPDVVLAYCTGLAALASHPSLHGVPLVLDMVDVDSAKWRDLAVKTAAPLQWVYAREARCLARFEADIVARARATTVVSERELQNKVLEALAAGLPVVVTPVVAQGLPDGVMPGWLVAGPEGDFAEAILSLLRQRPAARRAVAAQADCAPLRWHATLAPLLPLLDPAAAPRPAAPFGLSAAHAIG